MWDARRDSRVLRSRGSLFKSRLGIPGLPSRRLAILIVIRIVLLARLARGSHDEGKGC